MPDLTGRCTCGAVRYHLTDRPLFTHCCHCRWCRRETGSAFVLNAIIEAAAVEVRGTPSWITLDTQSGTGQRVARCPTCQVALWSVYGGRDPLWFIRVGTLDDPGACPPDIHIYTDSKLPWVVLPENVPAMPEFYRRSHHWPDWALKRRAEALA